MEWESLFGVGSKQIIQRLELSPGMACLDVGAGRGRTSLPVARRVGVAGQVTALDVLPQALEFLAQRAVTDGLTNLTTLHGAIETAKLPRGLFDRAIMVAVLGETQDREAALRQIFSALKPGGWLSLTEVRLDPHFQRLEVAAELAKLQGYEPRKLHRSWAGYTLNLIKPL